MGFESNRRLRKQYNSRAEDVCIGGKSFRVRSQLEKKMAEYLQILKESGHIADWNFEFMNFKFPDNSWLIDFTITELDGNFYHIETKGHFEARDRKKLKLLFKYFPQARVLYVFQHAADKNKMGLSAKYLWWRKPVCINELTKGII